MATRRTAKPDDQLDDVKKMQKIIRNTAQNMEVAEESMITASDPQRLIIEAKNERREESIERLSEALKEETAEIKRKK